MTFTLRSLFVLVTLSAIAIGLALAIGPAMLILVPAAPIILIGFAAHKAGKPIPFWQCVGAIVILIALLPPLGYRINEFDVVTGAIFFATAAWLIYRAILNGHSATQLLSIIIAIPYIFGISLLTIESIKNYERIIDFWWR